MNHFHILMQHILSTVLYIPITGFCIGFGCCGNDLYCTWLHISFSGWFLR